METNKKILEEHREVIEEALKIHEDYPSLTLEEVIEKAQEVISDRRKYGFRSENLESFF